MTGPHTPYNGATVAFASMHNKGVLARGPFRDILGADVVETVGLDTDRLGTFAGEIPRTLDPRAAARVKAALGIRMLGVPYALASEGSFSTGSGYLLHHHEVLLFRDEALGVEIVESSAQISPLPPARIVTSVDHSVSFATAMGFPRQRVVVRRTSDASVLGTGIGTLDELTARVHRGIAEDGTVVVEPDFRAHHCPTRSQVIRSLSTAMGHRLATGCPHCGTPGFGTVDLEPGLPCRDCSRPTDGILADVLGCAHCSHRSRRRRLDRFADPASCDSCNP